MKNLIITLASCFITSIAISQNCKSIISSKDCSNGQNTNELSGSIIDAYCFHMDTILPDDEMPTICPEGGIYNNPSWFSFIADSQSIKITIVPTNCTKQFSGFTGIQAGIFSSCPATSNNVIQCVSNCVADSIHLLANNFSPTQRYYLVIDGCLGSQCDVMIFLTQGTKNQPNCKFLDIISGEKNFILKPQESVIASYKAVSTGCTFKNYLWTIDNIKENTNANMIFQTYDMTGLHEICAQGWNIPSDTLDSSGKKCLSTNIKVIPFCYDIDSLTGPKNIPLYELSYFTANHSKCSINNFKWKLNGIPQIFTTSQFPFQSNMEGTHKVCVRGWNTPSDTFPPNQEKCLTFTIYDPLKQNACNSLDSIIGPMNWNKNANYVYSAIVKNCTFKNYYWKINGQPIITYLPSITGFFPDIGSYSICVQGINDFNDTLNGFNTKCLTVQVFESQCPPLDKSGKEINSVKDCQLSSQVITETTYLNGYCNSLNSTPADDEIGNVCINTGSIDNPSWLSFIAASKTIELNICPSNCNVLIPDGQTGMQAAIFSDCSKKYHETLTCSGICQTQCFSLLSSKFIVGHKYYLLLDGCKGSLCDYTIIVNQGKIDTSICLSLKDLTGPIDIKAKTPFKYTAEMESCYFDKFVWTINGVPVQYDHYELEGVFQKQGNYTICVKAYNSPNDTLNPQNIKCINVNVSPSIIKGITNAKLKSVKDTDHNFTNGNDQLDAFTIYSNPSMEDVILQDSRKSDSDLYLDKSKFSNVMNTFCIKSENHLKFDHDENEINVQIITNDGKILFNGSIINNEIVLPYLNPGFYYLITNDANSHIKNYKLVKFSNN